MEITTGSMELLRKFKADLTRRAEDLRSKVNNREAQLRDYKSKVTEFNTIMVNIQTERDTNHKMMGDVNTTLEIIDGKISNLNAPPQTLRQIITNYSKNQAEFSPQDVINHVKNIGRTFHPAYVRKTISTCTNEKSLVRTAPGLYRLR